MEEKKCISCKKKIDNISGSVLFQCPGCNDFEIIRCGECRKIAVKYTCPKCGLVGPN